MKDQVSPADDQVTPEQTLTNEKALSPEALAELQAVFPDMKGWAPGHMPPRARPFALGAGRRELVRRHARQDRSLLEAR